MAPMASKYQSGTPFGARLERAATYDDGACDRTHHDADITLAGSTERGQRLMSVRGLASVGIVLSAFVSGTQPTIAQSESGVSPEIAARMEKEKVARRACKLEVCNAFAKPASGAPISCDVTKTWTKDEIIGRLAGASFVWGYGHVQCSVKISLDRSTLAKAVTEPKTQLLLSSHAVSCNVDDKDASKGTAFPVVVSFTPAFEFANGEATTVKLDAVKAEGSAVASAAVSSVMTVDNVTGIVGRAVAAEINNFIYSSCKDEGIEISRK